MKHYEIRVTGKVQGVFFRASARDVAQSLGLRGRVRNEPDGSVYIEAEGEEQHLLEFTEWCKQGPPRARVSDVQVREGTLRNLQGFHITK